MDFCICGHPVEEHNKDFDAGAGYATACSVVGCTCPDYEPEAWDEADEEDDEVGVDEGGDL
jgi:hypothetical protein